MEKIISPDQHITPEQIAQIQKLFSEGIDVSTIMDGFDLLVRDESGNVPDSFADVVIRRKREERESDLWREHHEALGKQIAQKGWALDYQLAPAYEPDQIDWFGHPYDPPLKPATRSYMSVYFIKPHELKAFVTQVLQVQVDISEESIIHKLTPNFLKDDIDDLNRRGYSKVQAVRFWLPAQAPDLYKELMNVDTQISIFLAVSPDLACMVKDIETTIIPHTANTMSERRRPIGI